MKRVASFREKRFFGKPPRTTFIKSVKKTAPIVRKNMKHWELDRAAKQVLDYILGDGAGRAYRANLASNKRARSALGSAIRWELTELQEAHPEYRFRHATIFSDNFNFYDRDGTVPLEHIKRTVNALMRKAGISGSMGTAEFQGEVKLAPGLGSKVLGHSHMIIWTPDADFDFSALEGQLNASPLLANSTDTDAVTITGYDEPDGIMPRTSTRLLRTWCWYIAKLPLHGKNPIPNGKGGFTYKDKLCPPPQLTRLVEILSRMRVDELLISSGEGVAMASRIRNAIRAEFKDANVEDHDVRETWSYARRVSKKTQYREVTVKRWKHGIHTQPYVRGPYKRGGSTKARR